jgi:fibro-slime domain-containing protein
MRHLYLAFCVLGAVASSAFADLTVHLQSPFAVAAKNLVPHVVMNDAKPDVSTSSSTIMKDEEENWYSYKWKIALSNFKATDTFSIKGCPADALDNTTCVDWPEGSGLNVRDFFEGDKEVWIYSDEETGDYTKSFAAPGSKIVWFKSPWGNKVLPQMVFEQDTILMHFSEDPAKCGWFYGALSPEVLSKYVLRNAYFTRFNAPWIAVPKDLMQVIDLAAVIEKKDTIYVDGTAATPSASAKMGDVGSCFDKSRTLHVYNPWRNNSVYRDSTVYLSIDGVWVDSIRNVSPAAVGPALAGLAFDDNYKYWLSLSFPDSVVSSAAWKSDDAKVQITRSFRENIKTHYFSENKRPKASDLFPSGVYEAWFFASSTMEEFDISFAPLERKVVRLLSPWKNTPTSFYVDANDEVVRMSAFSKDTCGWFEGTYYKHAKDWKIYFKQSFGLEKYSNDGIVKEGENVGVLIDLDTLMSKHDTAWVYPSGKNYSRPEISLKYPVGRLGDCPSMKISAMILDWAGESYHDSIDVDFGHTHGGNRYTAVGNDSTCNTGEKITGMVQETLVNGRPARVDSTKFPWDKCAAGHEIDKWFVPEFIQLDPSTGDSLFNSVCKDIELQLDDEGFWYADYTNESGDCNDPVSPGFFPLDNFKYLDTKDSVGKVPNPKFDWDVEGYVNWASEGVWKKDTCKHNYGYAMSVSATFKYVKGQYFEFRGDDDVWVYINNRLVVDIGGIHEKVEGAVNLDTIGQGNSKYALKEGKEYSFHIFYAERNATGSNFKMRTSINLQKHNTYLSNVKEVSKNNITGVLSLKRDAEAISCDPRAKAEVDTTDAPSIFYLEGGSLAEAKELEEGINLSGGIIIDQGKSGFEINIDEIVKQRSLSPGTYTLYFFLESDISLNDSYEFTVPEYPTPEIAFVDVFSGTTGGKPKVFDPTNKNLRGETIVTGVNDTLMTHVRYPEMIYLKIMVTYLDSICGDCHVMLDLKPTNGYLTFYDEMDQQINTVQTDNDGYASFYVVAEGPMSGASFGVIGISGVKNQLKWDNLNFKDPEVPVAGVGSIYDRNGDGVPDSIYVPFGANTFLDYDLDTAAWNFAGGAWHSFETLEDVAKIVYNDSTVAIVADSLIDSVLTGDAKNILEGKFLYRYLYSDASGSLQMSDLLYTKIQEKIGAIALEKPMLKIVSDKVVKVTVKLSEACNSTGLPMDGIFELRDKDDKFVDPSKYTLISVAPVGESDFYELLFAKSLDKVTPEVGFKIRLVPGVLPDKSGNTPHVDNPWRRIEGEQPLATERPKVVTVNPGMFDENPWPGDTNDVIPVRVDEDLSLKEIIEQEGLPGVLVKFQLNDYATTRLLGADKASRDEILSKVRVSWDIEFFSSLGQYVNWVKGNFACNDKAIFGTDCIQNAGNMFFMWDAMSDKGRMVGTGVYIAKFKFKIFSDTEIMGKGEETFRFGIRRNDKYKSGTKKIK